MLTKQYFESLFPKLNYSNNYATHPASGVKILWIAKETMFPVNWLRSEVNAKAVKLK